MQDLQQQAMDRGDELERVAGAKERADGIMKRSDSNLQQANPTIKVPSASFLPCYSDLPSNVPSDTASCPSPLFSFCGVSMFYPSLTFML